MRTGNDKMMLNNESVSEYLNFFSQIVDSLNVFKEIKFYI